MSGAHPSLGLRLHLFGLVPARLCSVRGVSVRGVSVRWCVCARRWVGGMISGAGWVSNRAGWNKSNHFQKVPNSWTEKAFPQIF